MTTALTLEAEGELARRGEPSKPVENSKRNNKGFKELNVESPEASVKHQEPQMSEEMTAEGAFIEKKLDVMSMNLKGKKKTFDFTSVGNGSKKKSSAIEFNMASASEDNDNALTLPPAIKRKQKKPGFDFPITSATGNQTKDLVEAEPQPMLEPPTTKTKDGMKKKALFITGDEESKQPAVGLGTEPSQGKSDTEKSVDRLTQQEEPKLELPRKKPSKSGFKAKKMALGGGIGLDIDSINEEFTFGGEQGKKVLNNLSDEQESYYKDVSEYARLCVEYMSNFSTFRRRINY